MSNDMSYENKNSNSTGIKTKPKRKRRRRKHIAAQESSEELTNDKLPLVFQDEKSYERQSKIHDYERSNSSTLVLPKLTKFEKFDKEGYKRYVKSDSETDRHSISQTLPPISYGGLSTMDIICDNTGRNNFLPSISHRPRGKLKDASR